MDVEGKIEGAILSHDGGLNCAQSVLIQFCEYYGIQRESAALIASGFGGGMCIGKTCGALTGAVMALGLVRGYSSGEDTGGKDRIKALVRSLVSRFEEQHHDTECYKLIGMDLSIPGNREKAKELGIFHDLCNKFIADAVRLVEITLQEDQ